MTFLQNDSAPLGMLVHFRPFSPCFNPPNAKKWEWIRGYTGYNPKTEATNIQSHTILLPPRTKMVTALELAHFSITTILSLFIKMRWGMGFEEVHIVPALVGACWACYGAEGATPNGVSKKGAGVLHECKQSYSM